MRIVRRLATICTALLLAACASTPARAPGQDLFEDALFAPQAERIDARAVFEPSPEMLAFLANGIAGEARPEARRQALFDALYQHGHAWLDYDATVTRTAAEAYAARSGNCLSLVLMTSAMAKQLGLEVRYRSIYDLEAWSRGEGLNYLNTHVNLGLFVPHRADAGEMLIDFIAAKPDGFQRKRVIPERTLVAMYMNNRAVELLAQRQLDRAYWWARAAIAQDAGYSDAVNTLAVVYKARGRLPSAERALLRVLQVEPDNIVALDNLERVLREQQRDAEADALAARLKALRPIPPFHYYDLGMAALRDGRYAQAKELFEREMRRDARYDQFHAALALAHYSLGELVEARRQMATALENANTADDRAMYARMLQRLEAGQHP